MNSNGKYRVIISGGGTGGHIFPAISIANELKERHPHAEILFVGALGRMEMTRVPEAGYKIIGLPITGIQRKLTLSNLAFPFKLFWSIVKAKKIVRQFKPNLVIGTGGFASGPLMMAASRAGIPSILQESNSYAGLTNKQLAGKAHLICVAYPNMERFFPPQKIKMTGNPVRKDILHLQEKRNKAIQEFGFSPAYRTLLIIGGSLGSRTINNTVLQGLNRLIDAQVQVIWQTGKMYYSNVQTKISAMDLRRVRVFDFVKQMDLAYAAADLVVSRAGALAISEMSVAGSACILVPSPNVAEDHQTKNAMALVNTGAAVLVEDKKAPHDLISVAIQLLFDEKKCAELKKNILKMAKPQATKDIVDEADKMLQR